MTVQTILDLIEKGGSDEELEAALAQQERYDASDVTAIVEALKGGGKKKEKSGASGPEMYEEYRHGTGAAAGGTATSQTQAQTQAQPTGGHPAAPADHPTAPAPHPDARPKR